MDLALGLVYAGYHLWTFQRKPGIDIDEPYLLNIPAEIRLLIYDFVFSDQGDRQRASNFLEPLLTCRLVYQEAHARAYARANFLLPIKWAQEPLWTPRILKLPHSMWRNLRTVTFIWDSPSIELRYIRRIFTELKVLDISLDQLIVRIVNKHAIALFRFKYAPLFPIVNDFSRYVLEDLPLLGNVKKVVFPNPNIEIKRNFQHLFDPTKPSIRIGGNPAFPLIDTNPKKLGNWKYNVIREDKAVTTWRLELTHPAPGAKKSRLAKPTSGSGNGQSNGNTAENTG